MAEATTLGAQAAARLRAAAGELVPEVRSLPADLIAWIPGEGVWSIMDNLCHIREFVPFWTAEAQRIIQSPTERWGRDHTHAARLAAVANTAGLRLDDVLEDIQHEVETAAAVLAGLSDADMAVTASVNPRWDVKPASFVVDHLIVGHVEKHLGQIRRNVRQFSERP
jgi:uncharacterized damage-inducible protein DinB